MAAQQAGRAERQTTVEQGETLQLPVRTPEFLWGRGGKGIRVGEQEEQAAGK